MYVREGESFQSSSLEDARAVEPFSFSLQCARARAPCCFSCFDGGIHFVDGLENALVG